MGAAADAATQSAKSGQRLLGRGIQYHDYGSGVCHGRKTKLKAADWMSAHFWWNLSTSARKTDTLEGMAKRERDYKKEYADYHGKPEQIKRRAARNASRQKLKDAGVNVNGKDVDHKDHNPCNMKKSNLRARSVSANRADNKKAKK